MALEKYRKEKNADADLNQILQELEQGLMNTILKTQLSRILW